MDIKSIISNHKARLKNCFNFSVLILMVALAFMMIYRYHFIGLRVQNESKPPFQNEAYIKNIYDTNYYLYYKVKRGEEGKNLKPANLFLTNNSIESMIENVDVDYYTSELDSESIKYAFNRNFSNLGMFLDGSNGNLKYNCENLKTGYKIANYDFFKAYTNKKEDENGFEAYLKKNFLNYLVIEFDSKGIGRVCYAYGFNREIMNNYFMELEADKTIGQLEISDDILQNDFYEYETRPISNTRFIYAVPKNIDANFYTSFDTISEYINRHERASFSLIEKIARVILATIVIMTLAIPTKLSKEFWGFKRLIRLPFEILLGGVIFIYSSLLSNLVPIKIVRETISGNLLKLIVANGVEMELAKQLVNILNLGYWTVVFLTAFVATIMVKMIFKIGLREYLSRKSILVKILKIFVSRMKVGFYNILNTDFKKRYNLLFIIGVVVVVIGIFITIYIVYNPGPSILLELIYILVLGVFIKIIRSEIKKGTDDYSKLLELTRSIADGNLDKDIEMEDVGSYEEIKRQLDSIQTGYKKIVEEEIKSQKMKSELISNVSHDLKTPLTSILTYTDLLKYEKDEEKAKQYIDTIYRKSERLKVLIDDMFEISKAQTGNIKLNINKIDIVQLLKQSLFEVGDRFEKRNITLKVKYPDEKILLNLDGEKTYRVFENLLVNMSKYALENTRAYIEIFNYEGEVRIILKNISQTEIDYEVDDILERFRRGDKSRNTEGSGLGLSIAKSYIEVQGGKLLIDLDGDLFKAIIILKK